MGRGGRTASNSSLWARPTASTSRAWVRYMRVRTTSLGAEAELRRAPPGRCRRRPGLLVRVALAVEHAVDQRHACRRPGPGRRPPRRGRSRWSLPRDCRSVRARWSSRRLRLIVTTPPASASSRVNAFAYSALPTIAPSTPSRHQRRRGPAGRRARRRRRRRRRAGRWPRRRSRSSSRLGPWRVPSLAMSVTT